MTRMIDMNGVYEIAKQPCGDGTWAVAVRHADGYTLLSTMLTKEEADEKERTYMEAWVSGSKSLED